MIVGGRGTVPVTRNAIPLCYTNAKMHTAPSWIAEWKELSLLLLTARCTASLNGVVRALPVTIAISVFSSAIFRDSTKRVVSDQACLLVGGTVPVTRNAIPSKFLHPPHRLSTATRQRSVTCNGFDSAQVNERLENSDVEMMKKELSLLLVTLRCTAPLRGS
jgi:hypothetical protein